MSEWKAQINLRVRQDLRREMEEFALFARSRAFPHKRVYRARLCYSGPRTPDTSALGDGA
jgi:hypothetical protein